MHSSPNWMVPWDKLLARTTDLENANNISAGNPQERGSNMGYETEDQTGRLHENYYTNNNKIGLNDPRRANVQSTPNGGLLRRLITPEIHSLLACDTVYSDRCEWPITLTCRLHL